MTMAAQAQCASVPRTRVAGAVAAIVGAVALLVLPSGGGTMAQPAPSAPLLVPPGADLPLTEEEIAWARAAWAYFASVPAADPGPDADTAPAGEASVGAERPDPPLAPERAGLPVATAWSMGDQVAALVLAHRLGLIGAAEFDRRFSALLAVLTTMPLAFDGMPNLYYDVASGQPLGGDFQPGLAGWSAVDTGRLLLWLRVAQHVHPDYASFIRKAVERIGVCAIASPEGRLMAARIDASGIAYAPEGWRGYDAYAVQGYRAWGLNLALPPELPQSAEMEIEGLRFPVAEDVLNQPPLTVAPPAYLGFELGFEPIGGMDAPLLGGRAAPDLLTALDLVQARRAAREGTPTARAEFHRSEEPAFVIGSVLDDGHPWSVLSPRAGALPQLALISTRAVFTMDTFFEGAHLDQLTALIRHLHDPEAGWFEGRYEATGGWEMTRTSITNAFVLEALSYRRFGPLLPPDARPEALTGAAPDAAGGCRLPLASPP